MGPFNTREIAAAFWFLVFLAWVLSKADIRRSLGQLLRGFFRYKILTPLFVMALYTSAAVWLLAGFHLWTASLFKDTILWFCATAIAMMMRFMTSDDADNMFKVVVVKSITIVIVLEFLVNAYTFSLPVELVIVPVFALIAMLDALASSDNRYSDVASIIKGVQGVVGTIIIAIVVVHAISDLKAIGNIDTLRSVLLAPLLSLLFIPCLYGLVLFSKYELVFLRLNLGTEKDEKLKRYTRRRILLAAGLSLRKVQRLLRDHASDLMHAQTEADIDRLLDQSSQETGRD